VKISIDGSRNPMTCVAPSEIKKGYK